MVEDRIIDSKITLRDLLAQAVCMGVRAGRGDIEYLGPWHIADDMLSETQEVMRHRESIFGIKNLTIDLAQAFQETDNKS